MTKNTKFILKELQEDIIRIQKLVDELVKREGKLPEKQLELDITDKKIIPLIQREEVEKIIQVAKLVDEMIKQEGNLSEKQLGLNITDKKIIPLIQREEVEEIITVLMREVGLPANIKGYRYIKEAVILLLQDKTYIEGVTKRLYPDIAKKFNTTASRVERAIRHSIEVIFCRGNIEKIQELFSYTVNAEKGKLTNSEFIAIFADEVERRIKR